jgi:hypothetical protein
MACVISSNQASARPRLLYPLRSHLGSKPLVLARRSESAYQHTRGKRRFHFSPARKTTEASLRSDLCPSVWLVCLLEVPRAVPIGCRGLLGGVGVEAVIGPTAAGAATSIVAKIGSFKFTSAVGGGSRAALRPA